MTLYRKDANGKISFWVAYPDTDSFTGQGTGNIVVEHGKLDGLVTREVIATHRNPLDEINSRYKAKYKAGYKSVADVKDNNPLPVKGELKSYLLKYLPDNRTTSDGSLLPMLAKVYDNENNKLYKNNQNYFGQYKINGLRCFIRCIEDNSGLFNNIRFTFQSREGTYWNSLEPLNQYLLNNISNTTIKNLIDNNWILDGELYIPGFSINELNHIIKDPNSPYNKFVQFWCYDMYVENATQITRNEYRMNYFYNFRLSKINTKNDHLNTNTIFNIVPEIHIGNDIEAEKARNEFIDLGFEGLIMRPVDMEYEAGKRKMIKYKRHTDGIFTIIDIIPDGIKRPDVGKILCSNDINDAPFECHLSATIEKQKEILKYKLKYIGKELFIEYGERSGVNQVPFHIKKVRFVDNNYN